MTQPKVKEAEIKAAAERARAAAESGARPEATPTEFAGTPEETVDVKAAAHSDGFVRFTAHNGERVISAEDWTALGEATGQDGFGHAKTNIWSRLNAWRLPVSAFTQAQLNYLLNVDGEFTLDEE